jgi:exosome complex RNA-binding protein Rrp4
MRLANYEFQSVPNAGSRIVTRIVRVGDSLDRIARLEGSTTDWLKHLNHGIGVIRAGDIVHVQPAAMVRTITGWRQITAKLLQARYNGDRDLRYAQKIEHALAIVRSVGISACAR